jgi:hypothetical protein
MKRLGRCCEPQCIVARRRALGRFAGPSRLMTGPEASRCATVALLRAAIDAWQCPSVPLRKPAIDTEPSFVSLILHIPSMAPLQPQSPNLIAIQMPAITAIIQNPVRRFKTGGCTHSLESSRSSRTRTKTNAKNDNDSHSSCLLLTASSLRCASDFNRPSFAKSKAKQSDKVPDFQSSA